MVKFNVLMIGLMLMGCAQADKANVHLESMDKTTQQAILELKKDAQYLAEVTEEMKSMAESLKAFEKMGKEFSGALKLAFPTKPAAKTADIDEVLNEGGLQ